MWTCQKMAQWGPIAEDDDLAGRKCEKGASPSTDKVESLSHDLRFCHDATHREHPIAPFATNIGLQSGPLVAFSDTRAQKQRNRNAR